MPYEFGDIVLAPFPFTNLTTSKKRPASVISNAAYNRAKPDVVIMAITSQFRPTATLGEVWVSGWQAANLLKPSAIKPVFATLEQGLLIRLLGRLREPDLTALRTAIGSVLG
jgi:mRNA interferase MazF